MSFAEICYLTLLISMAFAAMIKNKSKKPKSNFLLKKEDHDVARLRQIAEWDRFGK